MARSWQGTDFAKELAADDAAGKVGDHLKNHYTVIVPGDAVDILLGPSTLTIAFRVLRGMGVFCVLQPFYTSSMSCQHDCIWPATSMAKPSASTNLCIASAGKGHEKYDQQAFATYFPDDIGAIASRLDAFVEALRSGGGPDKVVVDQYISYLSHYRWAAFKIS